MHGKYSQLCLKMFFACIKASAYNPSKTAFNHNGLLPYILMQYILYIITVHKNIANNIKYTKYSLKVATNVIAG